MKTIFPEEIFQNIRKKDGYIALVFILVYIIFTFIYIQVFKSLLTGKELSRLLTGIGFYVFPLIIIFLILKIRKQNLSTIGLRRKGFVLSLGIGIGLSSIVFIIHVINGRSLETVIYNLIFYVFILGFGEEIVFRGFAWPRFVVTYGRAKGTIISGIFFRCNACSYEDYNEWKSIDHDSYK